MIQTGSSHPDQSGEFLLINSVLAEVAGEGESRPVLDRYWSASVPVASPCEDMY